VTAIRRFRCQPGAVPAARRFVREALRDQPVEIVDAAELLTSELATNSVRHAHTDFELAVQARGQIRIEVRDTGTGQPRLLSPSLRDSTGRGLLIVDSMADAWGVIPVPKGKIVWFTLPHSAAASEASPPEASSPMDPSERHAEPTQERMTSRVPRRPRRSPRGASRHREALRST
jgi:anti-sigma regulatory factor (Ser/Thr protein kinase)